VNFWQLDLTVDAIQMTAVLVMAVVQVYIVVRLERTLRVAAASLAQVLKDLNTFSKRLDEVERRGSGGA
jgi:hypothetical protein